MKDLGHWIGGRRVAGTSDRYGDVFNPSVGEDAYFPGPAFWQTSTRSADAPRDVETSGITQPAIHAISSDASVEWNRQSPVALLFPRKFSPRQTRKISNPCAASALAIPFTLSQS